MIVFLDRHILDESRILIHTELSFYRSTRISVKPDHPSICIIFMIDLVDEVEGKAIETFYLFVSSGEFISQSLTIISEEHTLFFRGQIMFQDSVKFSRDIFSRLFHSVYLS